MRLYVAHRAPNPRRVTMFMAEKGITGIELVKLDLNAQQHHEAEFVAKSPLAKVPVLELDDGRMLGESRAICTWLEGRHPEPNLMGRDGDERAFIEMADRRMELYLFLTVAQCIRHTHPGLAALEQPQFPDFGKSQGDKLRRTTAWLDGELARQPFVAGQRFTIADITAYCALDFARGLMRYVPGQEGLGHLQAWFGRMGQRPSSNA
jgi:glutathione S-transferase